MQRVCVDFFDEDYYERGVQTGKSFYENYRYMPERSGKTAEWIIKNFPNNSILDFGCAKGFLVRALRERGVESYGYDVSEYAVSHGEPAVKDFLTTDYKSIPKCGVVIGKDVLEHIPHSDITKTLSGLAKDFYTGVFVVPLGDKGKYRISSYHSDKSHVIAENEQWWMNAFISSGWGIYDMNYNIESFKGHWKKEHDQGNAVFIVKGQR